MALLNKLIALVKKETLVLSKDVHGLVVLFVMPAVFILIMSMAMQDAFDEHQNVSVEYARIVWWPPLTVPFSTPKPLRMLPA